MKEKFGFSVTGSIDFTHNFFFLEFMVLYASSFRFEYSSVWKITKKFQLKSLNAGFCNVTIKTNVVK